jgi:hypothetical protein
MDTKANAGKKIVDTVIELNSAGIPSEPSAPVSLE